MVPPAVCEPIYVNQVVRITLFTTMPMLDDINIALMQRGDQSCGMVIPGAGSLDSIAGSHGQGGGLAGGCGGVLASGSLPRPWWHPGRWPRRQPRWWFWPRSGPDKGKDKHACVIHDDDEVSSDEDEPLQKRMRLFSCAGGPSRPAPTVPDEATTTKAEVDKEATEEVMLKRAVEEAVEKVAADKEAIDKRITDEAVVKEAAVKAAADKEAVDKRTTDEAAVKEATVGATEDSPVPDQAPSSVVGSKRTAAPSGSTSSAKRPYRVVWNPRFV
jgi:hypothetical protein